MKIIIGLCEKNVSYPANEVKWVKSELRKIVVVDLEDTYESRGIISRDSDFNEYRIFFYWCFKDGLYQPIITPEKRPFSEYLMDLTLFANIKELTKYGEQLMIADYGENQILKIPFIDWGSKYKTEELNRDNIELQFEE